ncbi:MAG: hypothetical protein ACM357_09835 [Gemmatimonadota bacterium]
MTAPDRSLLRGGAVWIGILVAANLNGALREFVLRPLLGPRVAPVMSTLLLCVLILGIARLSVRWMAPPGAGAAWRIGLVWLVLTLAFEFLAGRYLFGDTWERLLSEYDVTAGRLWVLVPITTLLAPRWAWARFARVPHNARVAGAALAMVLGASACEGRTARDRAAGDPPADSVGADSTTWAIRLDGAGPIRYGMSVADAAAALGDSIEAPPATGECSYLRLQGMPEGLQFMVERGRIVRGDVTAGTLATAHGARIGMTGLEVQALYGGVLESRPHKYDTGGQYLVLVPAEGGDSLRLVFETDGRVVTRYRTGVRPAAEYVEECG